MTYKSDSVLRYKIRIAFSFSYSEYDVTETERHGTVIRASPVVLRAEALCVTEEESRESYAEILFFLSKALPFQV